MSALLRSCSFVPRFAAYFAVSVDKHIFQRRTDFVNLRLSDSDAAQFFVDLVARDAFIDQQMHRLAEDSGGAHTRIWRIACNAVVT